MNTYENLAEQMLAAMDAHRHMPPEPVSATIRGEMAVLRFLGSAGGEKNAGVIAAELNMTTSRIAAVLNSLEKKEMISRHPDPADKRRVVVTLTKKGDDYRLKRRNEAKSHLTQLLMRLSQEEAAAYVQLTQQLIGSGQCLQPDKEV